LETELILCCGFLIESGADLNAKNKNGQTPLENWYVKKLKKKYPDLFHNKASPV
jgi:hypothetical protein